MRLDPDTLLAVNVTNLLVMSVVLPVIMGQRLSPAATAARRSLIINGLAWLSIILAGFWEGHWVDWVLSVLSMSLFSASLWQGYLAQAGWLGPRPYGRWLIALCILMPLGYALTYWSYPIRVGWSNLLFAGQLLLLARATLRPRRAAFGHRRWRYTMFGCYTIMGVLTALRGITGAWFTELYPSFTAPTPLNQVALLAANVTLVMANLAVLVAWREEAEHQLRKLAVTDALTSLLNRHGWTEQAERNLLHAQRHAHPLTLLMIDLDHFKRINDTYGHEGGDRALQFFGKLLQHTQRAGDVCARLGGEEFCVLLTESGSQAAQIFDQRLRDALLRTAQTELGYPLNYSCGMAYSTDHTESLTALMARADAALYQAKQSGRGQSLEAPPPAPPSQPASPPVPGIAPEPV